MRVLDEISIRISVGGNYNVYVNVPFMQIFGIIPSARYNARHLLG